MEFRALPFFFNYSIAFSQNCCGGFVGCMFEHVATLDNSPDMKLANQISLTFAKTFEVITGICMSQAAFLSLGYESLGLMDIRVVALTPIVLQLLVVGTDHFNVRYSIQNVLEKINDHVGHVAMLAATVSSIILASKLGSVDLLPFALVINSSYWIYKCIRAFKSTPSIPSQVPPQVVAPSGTR